MNKEIWYTARNILGPGSEEDMGWEKYLAWAKLSHLMEVVSLDPMLNDLIFAPNYDNPEEWKNTVTDGTALTGFFKAPGFVLDKVGNRRYFNFMAAVKEPEKQKNQHLAADFDFIGYELLDKNYTASALTNCGGFDESFQPQDLNENGLVSDFNRAKQIQKDLAINNPGNSHADCLLFEVWRHKFFGRK